MHVVGTVWDLAPLGWWPLLHLLLEAVQQVICLQAACTCIVDVENNALEVGTI